MSLERRSFLSLTALAAATTGCNGLAGDDASDGGGRGGGTPGGAGGSRPTGDATPSATPTERGDLRPDGDAYRVAVDALSDGSFGVDDRGSVIFESPFAVMYQLRGSYRGTSFTGALRGDRLTDADRDGTVAYVGPRLRTDDDVIHAYLVPAYDGGSNRLEFHAYVDAQYRSAWSDPVLAWRTGGGNAEYRARAAEFAERRDGIARATLTYGTEIEPGVALPTVVLVNGPIEQFGDTDEDDGFLVGVAPTRTPEQRRPPEVEFEFEYRSDAEAVVVTHAGGGTVPAGNLEVRLGGEPTDEQYAQYVDGVGGGVHLTIDASDAASGDRVTVVWTIAGGTRTETLAAYELP